MRKGDQGGGEKEEKEIIERRIKGREGMMGKKEE